MDQDLPEELTDYTCPRCGGMLARRARGGATNGDGATEYRCRIGHALTPAQLWIEHAAQRNRAVVVAARAVAENIELARALAVEARTAGNEALAARLEEEARSEERHAGQLMAMLEGLAEGDTDDGTTR